MSLFSRAAALVAAVLLAALQTVPASAQSPVEGEWRVQGGAGHVRIAACADKVCGWVVDTDAANGVGRLLLTQFQGGPEVWTGGRIIDPKSGRHYSGRLVVLDPGRLQITGCLVAPFCASQIWNRVSE